MPNSREFEARRAEGQPSRQADLAALCRQLVIDAYAPAAVLITLARECVYSLGPTDRYLRVAPGQASHDILAMARQGTQTKLRFAIEQAGQTNTRTLVPDCRASFNGTTVAFSIDVQPVQSDGETLLLLCFVDEPNRKDQPEIDTPHRSIQQVYQSTNEALETSKGELQSFNTVLTTLNGELQRSLERQRTTTADLQNILYSTDVATLFLDTDLNIRFFTPATKSLFKVIPGDIGRPLADLHSLAVDSALLADVQAILHQSMPIEREVEADTGAWYIRRVQPYRSLDDTVGGVVITFTDITDRKQIAKALEAAKQEAEQANAAKSRFLAAASHDLRQPLQTLTLLQGLLAKTVIGDRPQELVRRLDETLGAMSGMLNTLLDINKIDAGTVRAERVRFRLSDLFERLRDEFMYAAQAKRLTLRVVPCGLSIDSDPHLLEQMIRNLLANALKYTKTGKVLLGCRRHGAKLSIEIWDTGVGIPGTELQAIFEEYHQLDNAARERSRGLGLGLSIVQRLGALLDHPIHVRSTPGKGSVFFMEVALPPTATLAKPIAVQLAAPLAGMENARDGAVLIIEDDPEVRELLELFLSGEGHRTATAANGTAALALISDGTIRPDLILSDFNLPSGMDGLQIADALREGLGWPVPTIILTGDISTETVREIVGRGCTHLKKPIKLRELSQVIQHLLVARQPAPAPIVSTAIDPNGPMIFVVDDDSGIRTALRELLEAEGRLVEDFATGEDFLDAYRPGREACLLVDASLPGISGLDVLRQLREAGHRLPAIMITGNGEVAMAVEAMKAGASDFIEKPVGPEDLIACVGRALEQARGEGEAAAGQEAAANHVANLTPRQRQIMDLVLAGHPSKNIAADLGVSQRTVESHRASIMKKTGSRSLPALARLAVTAARES